MARKKTAPPTLEDRHNAALSTAQAALSTFRSIIDDLEAAANAHDDVAVMATEEADRLTAIRDAASVEANASREVAARIRSIVG